MPLPTDPNQPQSNKLQALQNLSNQLPVANSNVAQGQAAARNMQLQQAVAAAPSTANIKQTAQQTGAASAQQAGSEMIQNAQNEVKQQGAVGQVGLQQQQQDVAGQVAGQQQGLAQQQMDNVQKLASIDEGAKQELYDKQMQFQKDQDGRTMFNTIQLADYARLKSQSDEQYQNYAQQAQQLEKRNLQVMEAAYNKVAEDLNQKYALAKQKGDQQTQLQVAAMKREADAAIERAKSRAANNQAAWTAGGTVVGAGVGAIAGGPAGASTGASVGGALGGLGGSQNV